MPTKFQENYMISFKVIAQTRVFLNQRDVTFPFIQGNQNVFQFFFSRHVLYMPKYENSSQTKAF